MRKIFITLAFSTIMLCGGCVDINPAISKSTMGNLEIYVTSPQGVDVHPAQIYVDGIFISNVSDRLPVLYIKQGKHTIRVELAGTRTYEQTIFILGDPNHQFLNVVLEQK